MAENSKIEWTDHTFNPWIGCTKVSDGCKHCYAETLMDKRYGRVKWGPQGKRVRTSAANWNKPLSWDRKAKAEGRRYRVFCASLADVFEDKPDQPVMDEWRYHLLHLIGLTPNLDWLLLTKRPENAQRLIDRAHDGDGGKWTNGIGQYSGKLPSNVWIGTSVENQQTADERIPELLKIPAAVRFLSIEPLLGCVDLSLWLGAGYVTLGANGKITPVNVPINKPIHWVIVGGESGSNARPMHPDWARALRDQCQAAGVPFFFKQWGEFAPFNNTVTMHEMSRETGWVHRDGRYWKLPKKGRCFEGGIEDVEMVMRIGKKAAGRLLDGREWNEMPQ